MKRAWIVLVLLVLVSFNAFAQDTIPADSCVFVRVVDCGQGLCNIVRFPGSHFMVYDAGTKNNLIDEFGYDNSFLQHAGFCEIRDQLADLNPSTIDNQAVIEMLVISHAHEDHINAIPYIFEHYQVKRVLRTGFEDGSTYFLKKRIVDAIANEQATSGCIDMKIDDYFALPGTDQIAFTDIDSDGDEDFKVLYGLGSLPAGEDDGNITSIVISVEFEGHSVLFTGDSCGYAQDEMVANNTPIASDILIAPHHGSDTDMIDDWFIKIDPDYVIFSAGRFGNIRNGVMHWWQHPRQSRIDQLTALIPPGCGIDEMNIFSTDWGDNEGNLQWRNASGNGDGPGDDGVDIYLYPSPNIDPVVSWERNDIDPHVRP